MKTVPEVMIGEHFASMHERFDVNTSEIAQVLGEIGLQDVEIANFFVNFEDRFKVPTFGVMQPSRGWTIPKHENGIHVTGLDDYGMLMHPSPEVYGHTILHEIGHIDYAIRRPRALNIYYREERVANRFAFKNARIMADLVDYEINVEAIAENTERARSYDDQTFYYARYQKQADKILRRAVGSARI